MTPTLEFEDAAPSPPPVIERARPGDEEVRRDGRAPASQPDSEAETMLVAALMIDCGIILPRVRAAGITRAAFTTAALGDVFGAICGLHDAGESVDASTVTESLIVSKDLARLGGYPFITQITTAQPTTAQASFWIERVRERHLLRQIIDGAKRTLESAANFTAGGIDDLVADQRARLERIADSSSAAVVQPRPITSFSYPDGDDPNVLLGSDDYLGRGGGFLFVSHAGAGKSSWILDACMSWALARPWMGIRSNGPLRSLIIQAEDSDRYVGKLRASFEHMNKTTAEESVQLGRNCVIVRLKGISGDAFFSRLRQLTAKYTPDLVVINPIYLYAEGDISRSEFCQPFLVGLDAVNREEKWAYILVHHTGKPQSKDKNGTRAKVEDWESVYMGFGSSYLANWPRCSALLEPVADRAGAFTIKLGKGGLNAGVTKKVEAGAGFRDEPTTRIAIKHSQAKMSVGGKDRPVYYWECDTEPPPAETKSTKSQPAYDLAPLMQFIPAPGMKPIAISSLHRYANDLRPIAAKDFKAALTSAVEDGRLERVLDPAVGICYRKVL